MTSSAHEEAVAYSGDLAACRRENERLRAELREESEDWKEDHDALHRLLNERDDEIERLRARVQANQAQPVYAGDGEALRQCEAEVERLRAALMAIRTRTGIKKDENGDLWGWRHPGDGNNLPIYELADKALEGSGE